MMSFQKFPLSTLPALAAVLGLVACGHGGQPAQAPPNAAEEPPSYQAPVAAQSAEATGQAARAPADTGSVQPPSGITAEQSGYGTSRGPTSQGPSGAQAAGNGAVAPPIGAGESGQAGGVTSGAPLGGPGQGPSTQGGRNGPMGQTATGVTGEQGQPGQEEPMGAPADVSTLNDDQIASVVDAINKAAIQESAVGATRGHAPEVRQLAKAMSREHTQIQQQQSLLFARLQIKPSNNAVSEQLRSSAEAQLSTLDTLRGTSFDQAYLGDVIRQHSRALELLDRAIPNVKSGELKADLQSVRAKIAAHLADAERVEEKFSHATSNAPREHQRETP